MDWFLYDIGLRHERVKSRSDINQIFCRFQRVWRWNIGVNCLMSLRNVTTETISHMESFNLLNVEKKYPIYIPLPPKEAPHIYPLHQKYENKLKFVT